ncbi:AbgT family transporter [Corynebacterium massiliense]|uniref:p-aminobenzoyl-glutamate transport protein n=1 Tax=Corynebacterium massiliense DSM 45435 TaxID=1121364 RepID=A0ABY7U5T1_9CORY|nr:AbgT family transporter [Corynebacterium massiliense]WCZ32048.1 p-aminobenzoyl-glutamate transport protein [Corynebacterium massiliense DSM 45435]
MAETPNTTARPLDREEASADASSNSESNSGSGGFLSWVEKLGNKLPDPFWLFVILAGVVAVSSWIGSTIGMSATDPASGDPVEVDNLLTHDNISKMVTETVTNFTSFPPLGVIITVMLGVAVAEQSGFLSAVVRAMVSRVGPRTLTFAVAIAGVTGSVASDAIYVILIPLGAMAFNALGRSPIVGAMVAFAASSAGFNASLVLNITDLLLAGISTSAANIVDPDYSVSPLANVFFVIPSSVVLALIVTAVTELYVNKKATELVNHDEINYEEVSFSNDAASSAGDEDDDDDEEEALELSDREKKGMWWAVAALGIFLAVYIVLLFWPASPLASEAGAMESPLIEHIEVPIALAFLLAGVVYGVITRSISEATDVPDFMARGLKTLIPTLVLFFAASQFLAWFEWSNLGSWTAIQGSNLLQTINLPKPLLFLFFVCIVAVLNLFITSGSAQWALVAPVVVPMMMYVGTSPEVTQMLFRLGDSPTNIITPMSPYFALALTFLQRYYRRAGVGTLMSLSLPYAIWMLIGWFVFFLVWYFLGIPLGPGAPMDYPAN